MVTGNWAKGVNRALRPTRQISFACPGCGGPNLSYAPEAADNRLVECWQCGEVLFVDNEGRPEVMLREPLTDWTKLEGMG